jgi:hypothetical protein
MNLWTVFLFQNLVKICWHKYKVLLDEPHCFQKCFPHQQSHAILPLTFTQDFDVGTPNEGLMTMNVHLWGPNPQQEQLEILKAFNSPSKLQGAFKMGQDACLAVLTGIVNHMAPGGERMRELSSVSVLNQRGGKKRMLRSYSSR